MLSLLSRPLSGPGISNDTTFASSPLFFRSNKKRRKKGKPNNVRSDWSKLTPSSLWSQISDEAKDYFDHESDVSSTDELFEKYKIPRGVMLRCFCLKNGIQVIKVARRQLEDSKP